MRKLFIVLLIIPVFFLFIIGLILFDYIYYPLISSKAEKAAESILEKKYGEDFVIDRSSFSKPLGDDKGIYWMDAHPAKTPKLTVHIEVSEDMEPISDDYLDMKWRADLNEQFGSIYTELYGARENYSYMVNASFPDNTYTTYNISNTYQDVFKQYHNKMGNIVFANVLLTSSNEMGHQLDLVYQLIQHLKDQELEHFSIDINYYNEELQPELSAADKKLNYSDFSAKHFKLRDYAFHFAFDSRDEGSKNKLEQLRSSDDLKQYLRETKN